MRSIITVLFDSIAPDWPFNSYSAFIRVYFGVVCDFETFGQQGKQRLIYGKLSDDYN